MKSLFLVSFVFFALNTYASTQKAPDFTMSVKSLPDGRVVVIATPPKGLHFNLKAPLKIKSEIFICDNANSFCEKHEVEKGLDSEDKPSEIKKHSNTPLESGNFITNDPEKALAQAKQTHKPLLIDFYGIWCPPCNMLDEEVFSSKEFERESLKFVLLKLDADTAQSFELKSKYKVSGYPTVVFASENGDEISRVVGYKGKKSFFTDLKNAYLNKDNSFEVLIGKAKTGDLKSKEQLGLLYLERHEWDQAIENLKDIPSKKEQYFFAKTGKIEDAVAQGKKTSKDLLNTYVESINTFPDSPISLNDRIESAKLASDDTALKDKLLNDTIEHALKLQKNPKALEGTEYTIADVLTFKAMAEAELKKTDVEKRSWLEAAGEYEKMALKSPGKLKRGYLLEKAYCLRKAGEIKKSESIYFAEEKKYPNEFTFYFAHAALLLSQNRLAEAEKISQKALDFSYGDNHLRVVEQYTKILEAKNEKKEARDFLKKELASFPAPKEKEVRTHHYLKNLQASLDRLEKSI